MSTAEVYWCDVCGTWEGTMTFLEDGVYRCVNCDSPLEVFVAVKPDKLRKLESLVVVIDHAIESHAVNTNCSEGMAIVDVIDSIRENE